MPVPRASLLRARARQRCRARPGCWLTSGCGSRPRCRSWRRRRRWRNSRCRRWRATLAGRLNSNRHGRAGLKEAYCRVCRVWRLVCIKAQVIQCAPANRVGVLVLRKSFRVPGDRACVLGNIPRRAAVSLTVQRAVVWPTGMLRRRVKSDVIDVNSSSQRHTERLNRAIQIHVIESVLIVPNSSRWIGHFVTHKPEAVVSRIRLQAIHRRACPCPDGRLHSRSVAYC